MNVLVYAGRGTTAESVRHALELLRLVLLPFYAVVTVSEHALLNDPWMSKTAMLVVPGGADLPYCDVFNGSGNRRIANFVRGGGRYLGLCAGGYYALKRCEFEVGNPVMEVSGPRELGFFPGVCRGTVYGGFEYETHNGAVATTLAVNPALSELPEQATVYYNGGGYFVNAAGAPNVEVLATYPDNTDLAEAAGAAAVVLCQVGQGLALLSGAHPEFTPSLLRSAFSDPPLQKVTDLLEPQDAGRQKFFRACLSSLGLRVNDLPDLVIPRPTPVHIASVDNLRLLTIVKDLRENLDFVNSLTFEDVHDTFNIVENEDLALEHSEEAQEALSHDALCALPVPLHFYTSGLVPAPQNTPYFNTERYFTALRRLHAGNNVTSSEAPFGSVLAYGEVVTSTNTLMDANPRWLRHLPEGFAFSATTQIAGRGRGGNVWINPRGVMATSVLFKVPAQKQASIVTLQYLCALALIEAILGYGTDTLGQGVGYEDLPLRLKWPNDMYAMKPEYITSLESKNDTSNTVEGDEQKWAKVLGALVNSQYLDNMFYLVWGGGVNVLNSAPTTSLNQILAKLNEVRAAKGLDVLPPFEHEELLAKLVFTMGQFYLVFQRSGLQPFLPLYHRRWFHLDQHVKVDEKGDGRTRDCVIRGITADFGLLVAEDVATRETLELQPDGNSFDIFKGLVFKKRT